MPTAVLNIYAGQCVRRTDGQTNRRLYASLGSKI